MTIGVEEMVAMARLRTVSINKLYMTEANLQKKRMSEEAEGVARVTVSCLSCQAGQCSIP